MSAVAVVAGSGMALESLLDRVDDELPFASFPSLRPCSVAGHPGRFLVGLCGSRPLILQQGRLHLYEGFSIGDVSATVDILQDLGANRIIFTNAAGGLQPGLRCGSLMAIDRVATWPCRRWPDAPESLKPTIVIDAEARGAYVWVHGPSYETRTEIAAMRQLGYAAVGMSTAPEMARTHELGIESAAISCITNECGGLEKLTHGQVLATACRATARLVSLLRTAISSFA